MVGSWDCLEQLDLAIWDLARWTGDPVERAREALEHDPYCVLAHCVLALQLLAHVGAAPTHPRLLEAMQTARLALAAGLGGPRERAHAAAIEAWASGSPRSAAAIWEAWLLQSPRDLLALKGSHEALLSIGDGQAALESIARVRPTWDNTVIG